MRKKDTSKEFWISDLVKTEDLIDELEREIDQENEALEKEIAETYEEVTQFDP